MNEPIVEVPMFTYRKARAPSRLAATCGPCVVVGAIYQDQGFMTHYPSEYFTPLDRMLLELKKVSSPSRLELYLAGGGIDFYFTKEERKAVLENRSQTIHKITKAGFVSNLQQVQWGRGNSTMYLQLELNEKKAIFKEEYDEN